MHKQIDGAQQAANPCKRRVTVRPCSFEWLRRPFRSQRAPTDRAAWKNDNPGSYFYAMAEGAGTRADVFMTTSTVLVGITLHLFVLPRGFGWSFNKPIFEMFHPAFIQSLSFFWQLLKWFLFQLFILCFPPSKTTTPHWHRTKMTVHLYSLCVFLVLFTIYLLFLIELW